jgi:hypothetical protein
MSPDGEERRILSQKTKHHTSLSCRRTWFAAEQPSPSARERVRERDRAQLDPAGAVGAMLRQIAAGQGSLAMPEARGVGDRWLIAWGLADPQYARSRVEDELAAIEERRASQLLRLAELLAAPPALRAELLWEPKFMTWYPGRKVRD